VVGALCAWLCLIGVRLVYLQLIRHASFRQQADRQSSELMEIRVPRGAIYDRSGRPLAISVPVESVCINPMRAPSPAVTAGILAPILGLDETLVRERIQAAVRQGRGFLWIKRKVSLSEAQRLRALRLDGVEFRSESLRVYPKGRLASHVVGSVDYAENGNAGLEQALDEVLRGQSGAAQVLTDVVRRKIDSRVERQPEPGKSVTLTIDERIQWIAERELAKAVAASGSRTGSVVVMNPTSGEILAAASFPSFDPNQPPESGRALEDRMNHAISVPFEPGSVFKVITLAAALETTSLRPETVIPCGSGRLGLYGRVIRDHHPYAALTMADVLAKSSNIGAIQIGLRVGQQKLWEYVRRFGFGSATGLPLPAESAGKVRDVANWGKTSIASIAMGHELSATAVQLAQAISVVANGGLLVKPRLVLSMQKPGGTLEKPPIEPPRQVIRPETAITMRRLMEGVVLNGTGKMARLQGYTVGGKTGSAQIYDPVSHCYTHKYNASFVGFAPVARPAVVVAVTINGAGQFGGAVAAPVFREVAQAALRLLDIPKDLPDAPPPREEAPEDLADLAIAGLGPPASLLPGPEVPRREGALEAWGPVAPDFSGKTMRAALEESAALGLVLEIRGSGVVRAQTPPPGSILSHGQPVRLQFAR